MSELLSKEEVTRIKHEEQLRAEIRAAMSAESPKSKGFWASVWAGLNSNFGVWFLTAVFVTGLGTIYSNRQEEERDRNRKHEAAAAEESKKREAQRAEDRRRQETYERVTLEISYRYSSALAGLRVVSEEFHKSKDKRSHKAILAALRPLTKPASETSPPLFQEYASYSGLALIAELRRHAGAGEANNLKGILARTSTLLYEISNDRASSKYSAESAAASLISVMQNPKWDNGFAYTDCKSDNPFC